MKVQEIITLVSEAAVATETDVTCENCGFAGVSLFAHLCGKTCGLDLKEYIEKFPSSPIETETAREKTLEALRRIEAGRRKFDIAKTFGVDLGTNTKEVLGQIKPGPATPKLLPYYKFRKDLLASVLFALEEQGETLYLYGPSGSGKTSVVEQTCARLNKGVVRVNHDSDIGRAEIVGQWVLTGKDSMGFAEGFLPQAMRNGHVYIADEFDVVDPAVGMLYQSVLEGNPLSILETADVIVPHPDFRFIATGNTFGQGDVTGLHHGTRPMNEATMQRFTLFERVMYPTFEEEYEILECACNISDPDFRQRLLKVSSLLREAFMKDKVSITFSTRMLINVANKFMSFGSLKKAYEIALLNRLSNADRAVAEEFIVSVWGKLYNER